LGSTAKQLAETSASTAVAAALAPICVYNFQHANDAYDDLAAFKKVESWSQSDYIQKGGWATMPGSTTADSAVARDCATALDALEIARADVKESLLRRQGAELFWVRSCRRG